MSKNLLDDGINVLGTVDAKTTEEKPRKRATRRKSTKKSAPKAETVESKPAGAGAGDDTSTKEN